MKIGIVTYVKCDNYGAELQAYAMQYIFRKLGYDAELVNLEKREKDLTSSASAIIPAIINRFKVYGWKAPFKILKLVGDVIERKKASKLYAEEERNKHKLFTDFFENNIAHSEKFYTLESVYTDDMPYNVFVAGSDQIWNYMHTDNLDVYFLMFANRFNAKKISYAASISVPDIPSRLHADYKKYLENLDSVAVRELRGKELVEKYSNKTAEVVLDPTLLVTKEEWKCNVANEIRKGEKYVLIYTLSGSFYIRDLAKSIAQRISPNCKVINIKPNFKKENPNDGIEHLYNVGPKEWVGLLMNAAYIVTDSFHGTAFSINFNIPFTTLVNPTSNMNSRVMSILTITGLQNRIIYDDDSHLEPQSLDVDFSPVNKIIENWRTKSVDYIHKALSC
ncbi:MAG: polysaccharide pyruvyl transferase family protein [Bacteroidaceae bacterium]|nr:polysaccharide pyruvyl transferase family protein [Bacteroidaceae bacterium]